MRHKQGVNIKTEIIMKETQDILEINNPIIELKNIKENVHNITDKGG
jgi:hypothetical protein